MPLGPAVLYSTSTRVDPDLRDDADSRRAALVRLVLAQGREAFPNVSLAEATLAQYLLTPDEEVSPDLLTSHARDMFLAAACGAGDAVALSILESGPLREIPDFVARIDAQPDFAAEVAQTVRQKLLVAPAPGQPGKIAEYRGAGPLGGWIRVIAVRVALDLKRAQSSPGPQRSDRHCCRWGRSGDRASTRPLPRRLSQRLARRPRRAVGAREKPAALSLCGRADVGRARNLVPCAPSHHRPLVGPSAAGPPRTHAPAAGARGGRLGCRGRQHRSRARKRARRQLEQARLKAAVPVRRPDVSAPAAVRTGWAGDRNSLWKGRRRTAPASDWGRSRARRRFGCWSPESFRSGGVARR